MGKRARCALLALLVLGLLVWPLGRVRYEYGVSATWAYVVSTMDTLCWAVSRAAPIDVSGNADISFNTLFYPLLRGVYDPSNPKINSLFLGEGHSVGIQYWLPRDPDRKVVFATDAPLRHGFSNKYFHWIVTIDGKAKMISAAEFAALVARSVPQSTNADPVRQQISTKSIHQESEPQSTELDKTKPKR